MSWEKVSGKDAIKNPLNCKRSKIMSSACTWKEMNVRTIVTIREVRQPGRVLPKGRGDRASFLSSMAAAAAVCSTGPWVQPLDSLSSLPPLSSEGPLTVGVLKLQTKSPIHIWSSTRPHKKLLSLHVHQHWVYLNITLWESKDSPKWIWHIHNMPNSHCTCSNYP